ncbi:MAG: DNA-directed RNA polymerase subunit D [Thermoplasmatales archaeon]|nr:MAG: DNA-directed RNA polymerase subunit D [Thermoplasmatales archaeon]
MKVDVVELKPKKAVIKIEETQLYFVNSLRRVMLSELPKLAVEDVVIYDNTSTLYDEIISHRLGLIPIPTDLSILSFRNQCVCKGKGCPNCTVRYTLSKEGEGTVLSGDLQPSEKSWAIKEDKIPIVELYGDQRLILEIEAILGQGRDHAKWQAVQAPSYRMDTIIEFDKKNIDEVKDFLNKIPDDIASIKGEKIELKDPSKLPILESYINKDKIDFIFIKRDPTKVLFHFETDGSLTAKDAIIESAKILENKYSDFQKKLKILK